jgi:hypothetical protein
MKGQVNPVLRLFKWEDYHDGYMITFHPQTTFERFDDLVSRVKKTWRDDFEIDVPPGERLELLQPEDVPLWRGHTPELIKVEVSDGVGHQYSDATQGVLGDCWFMSALSGLAISGRLSEVVSRYDDRKGIYEFKLQRWEAKTRSFEPLYVCVDRRIPIIAGHKAPAFCYSTTPGELWPTLLEKAFAKAIRVWRAHPSAERGGKGFSCMDGGLSALGVAHLLGGESGCYWVKEGTRWDKEQAVNLAQLFADLFENGVFINVNFKEVSSKVVGPKGETRGNKGLVAGHSYSVLRLEFFNVRGQVLRLVQLRNPWGKSQGSADLEWHGPWSDRSPLWRQWPEAAQICLNERQPDGTFWMGIEDLADNMDAFEICDAPLRVGAVTDVRSKLYKPLPARGAGRGMVIRPSNELGARMADDYMRRTSERSEAERRRLQEQLAKERDQRLKLEAELEEVARSPKPCAPVGEVIEIAEDGSIIQSPDRYPTMRRNILQRRPDLGDAVDAADGVMDGAFFGRPIVRSGSVGAAPRADIAEAVDAADGVMDGRFYGRPIVRSTSIGSGGQVRTDLAEALDAADGVRDGRFYGRPIVSAASPVGSVGGPIREYEAWFGDTGTGPMTSFAPSASVVSNYSGRMVGPSTRTWVGEMVVEPVNYGRRVVDPGVRRRVVGEASVVRSVVRDGGVRQCCPVVATGPPQQYAATTETYVYDAPASSVLAAPVAVTREVPGATEYVRTGDYVSARPASVLRPGSVSQPLPMRAYAQPFTEVI